jgi:hypothetical protein
MVCSEEKENNIKSFSKLGLASTGPLVNATLMSSKDFVFRGSLYLISFLENVSDILYDFIHVRDKPSQKIHFSQERLHLFFTSG